MNGNISGFDEELIITLKCFFGFEETLKEELLEYGYDQIEILNRAVQFRGTWKDVYYLNLHSRCSISILVEIASFRIKTENDLYQSASKIKWSNIFNVNKTFAVKGAIYSDIFTNTHYPYLLVKDAIVEAEKDECKLKINEIKEACKFKLET